MPVQSIATVSNIENVTLTGVANLNATGNSANNALTGNSGINILDSGAGNDTLNGGAGADSLVGGIGNDTYVIDATDTVTEAANAGTDTIQSSLTFNLGTVANIENLTLTDTTNINGTGNAGNNVITGNSGNNILDGGAGADSLVGGTGDDTYIIDATDTVTEAANAGTDTIQAGFAFNLGTILNIENLTLTGTSNINGTGNAANNLITGNNGNNILDGGAGVDTILGGIGNDVLVGGLGGDSLTGNAGNDTFKFNNATEGNDAIADFTIATDILQISASGFGGGLVAGSLGAQQILIGSGITTASTAQQRFVYNTTNGALYFDADGSGSGFSGVQIATLSNKAAITNNDFLLIS